MKQEKILVAEAARRLKLTVQRVYQLMKEGQLPHEKTTIPGTSFTVELIPLAAVKAFKRPPMGRRRKNLSA
jgi:excisionase family DNA binding protein